MWYLPVIPVEAGGSGVLSHPQLHRHFESAWDIWNLSQKMEGRSYPSLSSTVLNFIQLCTEYLLCLPPSVNFAWGLRDQEEKGWKLSVSYVNASIEVFSLGNWGKMLDHWQRETFPCSGGGIFPCVAFSSRQASPPPPWEVVWLKGKVQALESDGLGAEPQVCLCTAGFQCELLKSRAFVLFTTSPLSLGW